MLSFAKKFLNAKLPCATHLLALLTLFFAAGCATGLNAPVQARSPFGRNVTLIYVPGVGGYGHDAATGSTHCGPVDTRESRRCGTGPAS